MSWLLDGQLAMTTATPHSNRVLAMLPPVCSSASRAPRGWSRSVASGCLLGCSGKPSRLLPCKAARLLLLFDAARFARRDGAGSNRPERIPGNYAGPQLTPKRE